MQAFIFVTLLKLFSRLPLRLCQAIGRCIGTLLYHTNSRITQTIRTNICRCQPFLRPQDIEQLVKQATQHTFIRAAEMPWFWYQPRQKVLDKIIKISGEEDVIAACKETKHGGAMILLPHTGAWEAVNLYNATHRKCAALFKLPTHPAQIAVIKHIRERLGTEMFPISENGVLGLFKAIKKGKWAGIFPDHAPGENGGIFVPFMGIPAQTMTLVPKILHKTLTPAFITYAERLPKGQGFHLHYVPVDSSCYSDNIITATTALNRSVEACVTHLPEQFEWHYKRFRRRPEGHKEPKFYHA